MLKYIVGQSGGLNYSIFLLDTETGYSGKDILSIPGIYEEVIESTGAGLYLAHLDCTIGRYTTSIYGLVMDCVNVTTQLLDATAEVDKVLTLPQVAAVALLSSFPEEQRECITEAKEVIHYYETITNKTRICIPEEAMKFLEPEEIESMRSARKIYALRSIDNQEIVQATPTSKLNIALPSLETLHSGRENIISALDILRVIAPCRKPEHDGASFSYMGIYHTPYYKVDAKIHGMVPSYLKWINGYASNNSTSIQPYEMTLASNLHTFINSDISRYIAEMISGIFFRTPVGTRISRLLMTRDRETIDTLISEIKELEEPELKCDLSFSEVDSLFNSGWYTPDVSTALNSKLEISEAYIDTMLAERSQSARMIDIAHLPFVLELNEDSKGSLTDKLIELGYLSQNMQEFLILLCKRAYEVNWGHTGACRAIPGFVTTADIETMNSALSAFLTSAIGNEKLASIDANISLLYDKGTNYDSELEDDDDDTLGGIDAEPSFLFDYYITDTTARRIMDGTLGYDFFSSTASPAETAESAVVEYWRRVNGNSKLSYFITSAYMQSGTPEVFIEAFIKLLRWGEAKPKLLVLNNCPKNKTVFDLSTGLEIVNTATVDDSQLILIDQCAHSLVGTLCTSTNKLGAQDCIIGFQLEKNYGSIKKTILMSWDDLGEMLYRNEIDIAEFKRICQISLALQHSTPIEDFEHSEYELFSSHRNIELSMDLKIPSKDLSSLALLVHANIVSSPEYFKALRNSTIVTKLDRQFEVLRKYMGALTELYAKHSSTLDNVGTTLELRELAIEFHALFTAAMDTAKPESNEVVAQSTIKRLQLDGDTRNTDKEIEYDTSELIGSFIMISDVKSLAPLPPITFTDARISDVAKQVKDRMILLLLELPDRFLFCRKDVTVQEILTKESKVRHKTYDIFAPRFNALCEGKSVTLNGKPLYLHDTLRDFI